MEITEVRVKLVASGEDRLRAFCSITIDDDFVVRDLKIIDGAKGPFVAMPSRKLMSRCRCGRKNSHVALYCNFCGRRLPARRVEREAAERGKLHADIAHPINSECRNRIQERVLDEYERELERAREPGYRSQSYDDFDADLIDEDLDAFSPRELAGISSAAQEDDGSSRSDAYEGSLRERDGGRREERDGRGRFDRRDPSDRDARDDDTADERPGSARNGGGFNGDRDSRRGFWSRRRGERDATQRRPAGDDAFDSPGVGRSRLRDGERPMVERSAPAARDEFDEPEDNFGEGLLS